MRSELEHLIDDVARVMTDAGTPPDLRGAVLARIDRRRTWWLVWLAAPVAAAALLALAIGLRDSGSPSGPAPASTSLTRAVPAVVDPPAAIAADPGPRSTARRRPAQTLSVRTIAALAEPVALTTGDIQPDALGIALLQMKPIVTEPLTVKVLDEHSGGRQ